MASVAMMLGGAKKLFGETKDFSRLIFFHLDKKTTIIYDGNSFVFARGRKRVLD